MHVVIAPQEFKGSLTAVEAARAIASGVRRVMPDAAIDEAPVSDGGAGLVDALLAARGGERRTTVAAGPLMGPITATWGLLPNHVAVIEMAAASGLVLLRPHELSPLLASTFGTGDLIYDALDEATEIIVGVGGSATVDAGAGAIFRLGTLLLDARGRGLPMGGMALAQLERIDLSELDPRVKDCRIRVASDVRNPLYGPEGAARVFGPQKGASPDDVEILDNALRHFADVVLRDFSIDLNAIEGTGAAGGLGAGLMVATGATIEPGFPMVADAIGLDERIARADLVITGEGRLDSQTAYGKAAGGVAGIARKHSKPVMAVVGRIGDYDASSGTFDVVVESTPEGKSLDKAMRAGARLVGNAAADAMRQFMS